MKTVIIDDVLFEVKCTWQKYYPETRDNPREGGYYEVDSICVEGSTVNLYDFLSANIVKQIEKEIQEDGGV